MKVKMSLNIFLNFRIHLENIIYIPAQIIISFKIYMIWTPLLFSANKRKINGSFSLHQHNFLPIFLWVDRGRKPMLSC